ncbi:MAG: NAD-dependent epimerase/dehydratase family protein [Sciscionella sp.]|nr:NAD-dependent epimerase/dehydratase family protein [Sciscionella sp.]
MRVLVLGGTQFLGRAIAARAVARGHDVVCAARGESGQPPQGARLVRVDRNRDNALAPLADERFDAVVDVATSSYPWVADALRALAARAAHWTFVSTINVYADTATPGQDASAELVAPMRATSDRHLDKPDEYGAIKVASENAVRDAMGRRAFVVRPGLITGPGDGSDRFGYWPARMAQPERNGGRVVIPDVAHCAQYIDVRDLAAWIVLAGEQRLTGTFDAVGPAQPLTELLDGIADVVATSVTLTPVAPDKLIGADVTPWSGPRSLPMWLPPTHHGLTAHDATSALDAGLRPRSLADAVTGALTHERTLGLDRPRKAGLSTNDEAAVLAALDK